MSTVRIQVRRGLASEWTSVNPILAAGEMGLESDTNFIKFGNGTDHWADLAYANEPLSDLQNTLADYVLLSDVGQPNGVASLNSSGKVPSGQLDISEVAQDAIANALVAGNNINITYDDAANHITVGVDNSISIIGDLGVGGATTLEALTINGDLTVNGTTTTVSTANFTTEDALLYIGDGNSANSVDLGIVASFNDGTYQHSGLVRDASDGVWKLFSGVIPEPGTTVDFTTHNRDALEIGSLSATNAIIGNVTNNEIQYLDGVTSSIQTQLDGKQAKVTNVSDTEIGYLDGVTSGIQTQLDNKQPKVANVSDTEIGYLDGVTSAIQTQLDAKLAGSEAATTYAPLANPTLTGTVTLPSTTSIGTVSSTEIGYLDGVTSAVQTQINSKAALNSPTFTGTVALPADTAIGNVSATEIGYLDGVTSAVQTQLTAGATNLTNHSNATTSVHGISNTANLVYTTDTGSVTSTMIANETIVNADINASAAIDWTKLAISSTVSATELGYVDGVTSGIQSQIDSKSPIASPTFTGTPAAPTASAGTNTTQIATTAFVKSAVDNLINGAGAAYDTLKELSDLIVADESTASALATTVGTKAPLANPTFTGTVTLSSSGIAFTDGTQVKQGVPSITTINQQSGAYTPVLTDRDKMIEIASASGVTVTIPTNASVAYPVGTSFDILQTSTGQITIAGASGVTVNATPGLKLRTQWSSATLFKRATDTWVVYGDLTA